MKNVIKSIIFTAIFVAILYVTIIFLAPGDMSISIHKKGRFEILEEKKDTIEAVVVGDSLVYSSYSPMVVWNEFGYTSFAAADPAQVSGDMLMQVENAIEHEHPKVILLEGNVLFRNPKERKWSNWQPILEDEYLPFIKFHDNWKNLFKYGSRDEWINVFKGYKYITKIKSAASSKYIEVNDNKDYIYEENAENFEKIYNLCKENDIKLVLISIPSQKSYKYEKHNMLTELANQYNIDYIDLNLIDLGIDWKTDTKDAGSHLNRTGAVKVTMYLGNYLKETNLLTDYRDNKKYASWNEAYEIYVEKTS